MDSDFFTNINFINENLISDNNTNNINNINNKIITDGNEDYINFLNYNKKLKKDINDKYNDQVNDNLFNSNYRNNNTQTIVDEINFSNPIIYPKEHDLYFEYINKKKINSLNTKVITHKKIINIDSLNKPKQNEVMIDKYYKINDNSLLFRNNSSLLEILIENANLDGKFSIGDKIIIRGFTYYKIRYDNLKFIFNNRSNILILDLITNYNFNIPYHNVIMSISGVTNNNIKYFKNIPLNLLNQLHIISIQDNKIKIELPIKFYNDIDLIYTLTSNCEIIFYNIGNYPINLINNNLVTENLCKYHIISNITSKSITVDLKYNI